MCMCLYVYAQVRIPCYGCYDHEAIGYIVLLFLNMAIYYPINENYKAQSVLMK